MTERVRNAIGVAALAVAMIALGVNDLLLIPVDEHPDLVHFLAFTVICAAVAAAIWFWLIPNAETGSGGDDRLAQASFVAGLVALAGLVAFPTALPIVLGAGAFVMGRMADELSARAVERSEEESRRRDETQAPDTDEREDVSPGQRASQGWAGSVMGAMAAVACVVLFVVVGG